MIEQLSIFDLPPSANPPSSLFDHQREGASFHQERIYTKRGKVIVDGKYKRLRTCAVCAAQFYSSDGGNPGLTCSPKCRDIKRHYGSVDGMQEMVSRVVELLEQGKSNTEVSEQLGLCKQTVKKLVFEKYGGVSPIHAKAIDLYRGGMNEDQIADQLNRGRGQVVTWLMHNIDGYVPPRRENKISKRRETAKYLWLYRKMKNTRLVAQQCGVSDTRVTGLLRFIGAYKKIIRQRNKGQWTRRAKAGCRISQKYKNESEFRDALAKQLELCGYVCKTEEPTGETTSIDIYVTRGAYSAVIECKWDVKITLIHKGAGQALIAKSKLNAQYAFVCYPDDVNVSVEAVKDCQSIGVEAGNESNIASMLELREAPPRVALAG